MTRHLRRPRLLPVALVVLGLVAASCSDGSDDPAAPTSTTAGSSGGPTSTRPGQGSGGTSPISDEIQIEVVSSQPDRVSGDDARIRVVPARGGSVADLRVELDGTDVTGSLHVVDGTLEGVVEGFVEGNNTLTAKAGSRSTSQRVRAWPISGPVISGPHMPLLACSTEKHELGPATDEDCSAPTKVTWSYIDEEGELHPLSAKPESTDDLPDDIDTARIEGKQVPLLVRVEKGVINRSVYEIASIEGGWNRKLMYRFGGGCGTTYGQGASLTTAVDPIYLAKGYALATATFNTFQVQCNDVLSAETTMMVKERFIEEFGRPRFTIGEGASGGSIQLHLIAQNYPGLVDGVVASLPFPDAISIAGGVADCGLLLHYYETPTGKALTDEQRTAVNGHATSTTCKTWEDTFLEGIEPSNGCDPAIAKTEIYDPVRNKGGIRCTLQDANINQLGRDEATGFANRPLDNVGVQYGLEALNERVISVDHFLDLNAAIGGYDVDGNIVPERHEADAVAVQRAYETGRVAIGGGDMLEIPIIDINVFTDRAGDIHDRFRAFSLRDRLTNGGDAELAPGFQIWTRDPGDVPLMEALSNVVSGGGFTPPAVEVMDEWLTALEDDGGGDRTEALRRTRPEDAVDNCLPEGRKTPIGGIGVYDRPGPCRDDFPIAGDPRTAAGAPRRDDIIKCQLKPIDQNDYLVPFTGAQIDRLGRIFPSGVCDWTQAGVGQTVPVLPDRSYEAEDDPRNSV